jgi:hypothetical protein
MTFIELGVHYKWQIYDYSSHTLSDGGAASKWDAWKQDSGATTFLGIIWWRLKWSFVFILLGGAVVGLGLWVNVGERDPGIVIQ